MSADTIRLEQKRDELSHDIEESMIDYTPYTKEISQILMDSFCSLEPPEIEIRPVKVRKITFQHDITGNIQSARSLKPGNVRLNWKNLLISGAEITFPTVACVSNPILIPLAALIIWNKIWTGLHINLDQRHAIVLWTMWHNCDNDQKIEKDIVLNLAKEECKKYNIPAILEKELSNLCSDLEKIKCIENSDNRKMWSLIEKADISYS